MKRTIVPPDGRWDHYLSFFDTLDKAKVPIDSRWRSFILYLREIKEYNHLSDAQKVQVQTLLTKVLEKQDFSEQNLKILLTEYHTVVVTPYKKQLTELLREASAMLSGFQKLLVERCTDITKLEDESVNIVMDENDTEHSSSGVILKLHEAFSRVKGRLEDDMRNLETLATCDGVTQIANRRKFDQFMTAAVERWLSEARPIYLTLFDIDHFKRFNDEHGHAVGDQVLTVIGMHLQKILTRFDENKNEVLAARYGGEEFVLAVSGPEAKTLISATEECRAWIEQFNFLVRDPNGNVVKSGLRITVSAGVATALTKWQGAHLANLIDNADKALYFAKHHGRNRTVLFLDDESGFSQITPEGNPPIE
ncbi:MAG: GGDEF domain-containing protein [Deltaproteobacteria bacterium]|jgi:diguanylate cyclase (GGDEF)-like protein|nr:GGDEF domain-containing protein [Deltaproteobacteria bacterium]